VSFEKVALGDICDVLDSKRKPITKRDRTEGDFPYYGATGVVDYVGNYIFDEKLVLIGEDGAKWLSGDKTAFIAEGKFWVNNHAHVIKPFRNKVMDEWIVYYFWMKDLSEFVTGLTVPKLNQAQLKIIPIPLPPLATQQKIVERLDGLFAEIERATAATESNVKNAEALFQSYLTEVFERGGDDWIDKKLSDVSVYFGRGKSKHRPRNDDSLYGGSYPFIQTGDVRNAQKYITSYSKTYNEKGLAQSKLWKANTVCITIAANIAEIGVLKFDACFPDSVIGIVVDNEKISEDFLYLMLLFAQQLIKSKSKGSAQENINLGTFEDMFFKVPPKVNQDKIVTEFNHLKNITDFIYSSKMKKINSFHLLKQSILNQAFNGELVKE